MAGTHRRLVRDDINNSVIALAKELDQGTEG